MLKKWFVLVLLINLVSLGIAQAQDTESQPPPPAGFFVALGDINARIGQNFTLNCTDPTDGSTCRMSDERLNWKWRWEQFPDSSIGCPQAFANINPVQTTGYVYTFTWQNVEYNYHQDGFGQAPPFLCVGDGREDITTTGSNVTACSALSEVPVMLEVINNNIRSTDLYWIDFSCNEVYYQTVAANGYATQSTYTGHVWIVRDTESSQLLGQITAESDPTTLRLSTASPAACTPQIPTRLSVSYGGRVTPGLSNNMRVSPGLNNTKVGEIPAGGEFTILAGPVCADNMSWWEVSYDGLVGWTAEGKTGDYWLEPANLPTDTASGMATLPSPRDLITAANTNQLKEVVTMQGATLDWSGYGLMAVALPVPPSAASQTVAVYDFSAGENVELNPSGIVLDVAISRNPASAHYLATLSSSQSGKLVTIWDAVSGNRLFDLVPPVNANRIALSPDGTQLAISSGYMVNSPSTVLQVQLIDMSSGIMSQQITFTSEFPLDVVFSPDGSHLAMVYPAGINLYSVPDLTLIGTLPVQITKLVTPLAFSPDGTQLAVGATDTTGSPLVSVWDVASQTEVTQLPTTQAVLAVDFNYDGTLLAASQGDFELPSNTETVTVWNMTSGSTALVIPTPNSLVTDIGFSDDGTLLTFVNIREYAIKFYAVTR